MEKTVRLLLGQQSIAPIDRSAYRPLPRGRVCAHRRSAQTKRGRDLIEKRFNGLPAQTRCRQLDCEWKTIEAFADPYKPLVAAIEGRSCGCKARPRSTKSSTAYSISSGRSTICAHRGCAMPRDWWLAQLPAGSVRETRDSRDAGENVFQVVEHEEYAPIRWT